MTLAKIELENIGLSVCGILGLVVNILTVDDQYSLRNRQNLWQPNQLQLSQKRNFFFQFLAAYLKFTSNVERCQNKKMTVKGYVFFKLETAKDVVSQRSKKTSF